MFPYTTIDSTGNTTAKEIWNMKKERRFLVEDINCEIFVEVAKRQKEIFDWLDEYIDNFHNDWFDPCDDSFDILYNDGTYDFIDGCYDGHKIKRKNIASIVYNNPCTYIVFGKFEINEYGVVTTSFVEKIAEENIKEIA